VSRRFVSSGIDPRRLSMLDSQRLSITHGERRRIHGEIRPMAEEPPGWRAIGLAALAALAIVAFTWLAIPALAEWSVAR